MLLGSWGVALTQDLFVVLVIMLFPYTVIFWLFGTWLVGAVIAASLCICVTLWLWKTNQKKVSVVHPKQHEESGILQQEMELEV